jgi:hypothetical protein
VFLAKRTHADIVRNAFVSIFLRSIEYYQGILFLTTNRREEFDDAFQSRSIWRNLLEGKQIAEEWDQSTYDRFAKRYTLNGREIKNLISTAVAMTSQIGGMLDEKTIEMVYQLNQNARVYEVA